MLLDHDVADVFQRLDQAHATDQVLLGDLREHAPAGVGVVGRNGLNHLLHRQVVVPKATRIDQGLELFDVAALRVDFGHTRDRAQQGAHHPVLHRAALGQFFRCEGALTIVWFFEGVLVDLTQTGGHGAKHRHDARRHAGRDFDQALGDQLPCKVDVGLVGEHQRDDRQPAFVQ